MLSRVCTCTYWAADNSIILLLKFHFLTSHQSRVAPSKNGASSKFRSLFKKGASSKYSSNYLQGTFSSSSTAPLPSAAIRIAGYMNGHTTHSIRASNNFTGPESSVCSHLKFFDFANLTLRSSGSGCCSQ